MIHALLADTDRKIRIHPNHVTTVMDSDSTNAERCSVQLSTGLLYELRMSSDEFEKAWWNGLAAVNDATDELPR